MSQITGLKSSQIIGLESSQVIGLESSQIIGLERSQIIGLESSQKLLQFSLVFLLIRASGKCGEWKSACYLCQTYMCLSDKQAVRGSQSLVSLGNEDCQVI